MRNDRLGIKVAETNSRFCQTRFVPTADACKIFIDCLNNHVSADGGEVPVILIGQG